MDSYAVFSGLGVGGGGGGGSSRNLGSGCTA